MVTRFRLVCSIVGVVVLAQVTTAAMSRVSQRRPLFVVGKILYTPAVMRLDRREPEWALTRHFYGDWGDSDGTRLKALGRSFKRGEPLSCEYCTDAGVGKTMVVLTPSDRSQSVVCMSDEVDPDGKLRVPAADLIEVPTLQSLTGTPYRGVRGWRAVKRGRTREGFSVFVMVPDDGSPRPRRKQLAAGHFEMREPVQ